MRACRWECGIIILLVTVTAALFWPVLQADFVAWDDNIIVYKNPHLQGLTFESLRWMFTDAGYTLRYQPLTWLTWSAIHEWSGLDPFGYHFVSLICHCFNVALVFLLIRKLLLLARPEATRKQNARLVCSTLGAALWALHPLRVEVVAWVSAYLHSQALFFLLLATLFYLAAHSSECSRRGRLACQMASALSYAASLLSYPIGLGFVVVLATLDVWLLRRLSPISTGLRRWWDAAARRVWLEKIPFAALAIFIVGINLLLRFQGTSYWPKPVALAEFGLFDRFAQACYIWAYYFWKPWLPFDLSPFYDDLVQFRGTDPAFLASIGVLVAITTAVVLGRNRRPLLLAAWLCYLVLLVPVLGLTEHPHFPSDRYSLVAGVVWASLIAGALFLAGQRRVAQPLAIGFGAVAAMLFAGMTAQQLPIWHNSVALFRYMIQQSEGTPHCYDFHVRLGFVYRDGRDYEQARQHFARAVELNPASGRARHYLASVLADSGKLDEAIAQYAQAVRLRPGDVELRNGFGVALASRGDLPEALEQFQAALRIKPESPEAHQNLGSTLARLGKSDEARLHFDKARQLAGTR